MPEKKKSTSWEGVADWYSDSVLGDENSYQARVILPGALRLLDLRKSEKIIDIAGGEGYFAREFAKVSGEVWVSDLSTRLIALAKKKSAGAKNIRYFVSRAENLSFAKSESFDKFAIILALQNIENIGKVLVEAERVLKPGGSGVIVLNHPAFRVPSASSWGWDEAAKRQYRRVDAYLSESRVEIQMHPGADPKKTTPSFHRPLQVYFKALQKAGFAVVRLEEWISHRTSEKGPRSGAEDAARREFPLFLALQVRKN